VVRRLHTPQTRSWSHRSVLGPIVPVKTTFFASQRWVRVEQIGTGGYVFEWRLDTICPYA
jgi:hypothetical protein